MSTRTAVFDADGDWLCPAGVSMVWATMVGGGAGASGAADSFNFLGASGGSGSGELMMGRPTTVIPGHTYSVVVGNRGGGLTYARDFAGPLELPTSSSFNGLNALPGKYSAGQGQSHAGGGGGCGGSTGGMGGGGFNRNGTLEGCNFVGGSGGSFGSIYVGLGAPAGGTLGGISASSGTGAGYGGGPGGAGVGGGALWGGNDGGNAHETAPNGSATHYGAGAGGAGEPQNGSIPGGNGSPGRVMLMWAQGGS